MSKVYYPSNVERYRSLAEKYSKETGVPVDVILQTIKKESAGNPDAWNPQNDENSRGLMQISEPTALTHPAINIPFMLLDTLYQPEENIKYGARLLAWIYKYLNPYFPKYVDEKTKWKAVSSGYNQGHGYYKWALETLDEKGEKVTWDSILNYVLTPEKTTRTPWRSSAQTYGPSVIDPIPSGNLVTPQNIRWKGMVAGTGSKLSGQSFLKQGSSAIGKVIFGGGILALGAVIYTQTKGK
jgi:hypothetical protein